MTTATVLKKEAFDIGATNERKEGTFVQCIRRQQLYIQLGGQEEETTTNSENHPSTREANSN